MKIKKFQSKVKMMFIFKIYSIHCIFLTLAPNKILKIYKILAVRLALIFQKISNNNGNK